MSGAAISNFPRMGRREWSVAVLIFAVVVVPYGQVWRHGFTVMDDRDYVTENVVVQKGLSGEGLKWAFEGAHFSNWHPLTWLSHMADCEFFGMNAGMHHLVNVWWHGLNAVVLFVGLRMMTGALWRSVAVALFFGLHPQRVESVAWVSERKDVLSGFFWMVVLVAWAWYAARPGRWRYAMVMAGLGLGLMSKSMLVTLPFVLLLLDVWPLGRARLPGGRGIEEERQEGARKFAAAGWGRLLLEKVPLMGLAVAGSVVAVLSQGSGRAITSTDHLGVAVRVGNALVSWAAYVVQMVWPFGLVPFYPHPVVTAQDLWWELYVPAIGAAVGLLAVTWGVLWGSLFARKRRPWLGVGWFWYVGTLVPVIGIVQIGVQARADRYTYLPMIGLGIMVVWGAGEMVARWPGLKRPVAAAGVMLGLGLAALSWVQVSYWSTDEKLFGRAIRLTKNNYFAHNALGLACHSKGDHGRAAEFLSEAIRIHPRYAFAHNNLGLVHMEQGDLERPRGYFERSMELNMPRERGLRNLALVLVKQERNAEAAAALEEFIELAPRDAWAHSVLALTYLRLGREGDAETARARAVELGPRDALTWSNVANVHMLQGRFAEAAQFFEEAGRLAPADARARLGLGLAYSQLGRLGQAEEVYRRALEVDGENSELHNALAVVCLRRGDTAEGRATLERVLAIDPANAAARRNLEKLDGRSAGEALKSNP